MPTSAMAVLDALGDANRRAIIERLREGPQPVGALARELPISRPAVSQHLKVLEEAELVTKKAAGTRHLYRIDAGGLRALRDYLDGMWSTALAGFAELARSEAKPQEDVDRTTTSERGSERDSEGDPA